MKITIYGATGNLGHAILEESVARGHVVVSVARSERESEPRANHTSRSADLGDLSVLRELDATSDVIVVSVCPDRTGLSHEPLLDAHRQLISSGLSSRIFVVGGAGSLEIDGVRLMDAPDFPDMFKPEASTMKAVLDLYRGSSGVNWTMIAPPPEIMPGTRTGNYSVGENSPVGSSISTEDFAVAVLDEIETPQHVGERFTVAN
jgi:putative NADH-flavin reductase